MRSAAEGRVVLPVADELRVRRIGNVENCETAVAPRRVGEIAGNQCMMQGKSFAFRPGRRFAAAGPNAGKPPFAGHMWLCGIGHVDDRRYLVAEMREMDRRISIAPSDIPDAMRSNAV